jgi:hypothetical protein
MKKEPVVRIRFWVTLALWVCSVGAQACAICAPANLQNTLFQRLASTDRIVIAQLDETGRRAHALATVRGALPPEPIDVAGSLAGVEPGNSMVLADPAVLVFNAGSQSWWVVGRLPLGRLPCLW